MPSKKTTVKSSKAVKTSPKKVTVKAQKSVVKESPKPASAKALAGKETGLKLSVYSTTGKVLESMTLPKEIFGVEPNENLVTQAVRVYLANQRSGSARTKSRGEVKISTRKIYRQKGTGRARHGAKSAPIFVGGGIAFGPKPKDFSLKLTQKAKKAALFSALSSKLKDGSIKVVSGLEKLEPKTKLIAAVFSKLSLNDKKKALLLVLPNSTEFKKVTQGARNIKGIDITSSNLLNTYEVMRAREILFMKDSINSLKENFVK